MISHTVPSTLAVRAIATPQVFNREDFHQWVNLKKGSIGTLEEVPDCWRADLFKRGLIVRIPSGVLTLCTESRVVPLQSLELEKIKQGVMVFFVETTILDAA